MATISIKKSQLQNRQLSRRIRGQGMTEYIIIVALIAIAAIGVVGVFGDVVRTQFAGMAEVLGGGAKTADTDTLVQEAGTQATKTGSLKTFGTE